MAKKYVFRITKNRRTNEHRVTIEDKRGNVLLKATEASPRRPSALSLIEGLIIGILEENYMVEASTPDGLDFEEISLTRVQKKTTPPQKEEEEEEEEEEEVEMEVEDEDEGDEKESDK